MSDCWSFYFHMGMYLKIYFNIFHFYKISSPIVTHDGKYLLIVTTATQYDEMWYFAKLGTNGEFPTDHKLEIIQFIFDLAEYMVQKSYSIFISHRMIINLVSYCLNDQYVTSTGSEIMLQTNEGAPNGRIVVIDLYKNEKKNWITVIKVNNS